MPLNPAPPAVSVIVPILNEAGLLRDFLLRVRSLDAGLEIIVVDGGSSDGSISIAQSLADQVVVGRTGRASHMNVGAAIARGEAFWFLHADSSPPSNAVEKIRATLSRGERAGGCFSLRYPRSEWIYRVSDSLGNVGVRIFGLALGDHGLFCGRAAFFAVGGYPIVPILEDAELYRRLRRVGDMRLLPDEIVSDPRAFEKCGRYRTTAWYFLILALYVLGVPILKLNKIYRRFHRMDATHVAGKPASLEVALP